MMGARFELELPGLLEREGGLVDHPNDPGGLTKFGISLRAYPQLGRDGIRELSEERAGAIYRADYWDPLLLSEVDDQSAAAAIFDFAVNAGIRRSTITTQRIVGAVDDGRFGPKTLAAVNAFDPELFVARFTVARVAYYLELSRRRELRVFLRGWIRRALELDRSTPTSS